MKRKYVAIWWVLTILGTTSASAAKTGGVSEWASETLGAGAAVRGRQRCADRHRAG